MIKVNVGDSFLDSPDIWGIWGVFSDSKGKVFLQFGKKVYVDSTLHTKVLAFRKGS